MPNLIKKKRKIFFSKNKGFTLLEVLVAVFIFTLIMISASVFFSRSIKTYRSVRSVQRNLEDAQYAMNVMAKTLRTSTIISPTSPYNGTSIIVYDYSRTSNACIQYTFNSSTRKIQSRLANVSSENCSASASFNTYSDLTNVYVDRAYFYTVPSTDTPMKMLGRVTILFEVCSNSYASDRSMIQTSVSLRDYGKAGL